MVGFPAKIDRHATLALLENTIRRPRQKERKHDGDVQTDSAKAKANRTKPTNNVLQELDLELDKVQSTKPHCIASWQDPSDPMPG